MLVKTNLLFQDLQAASVPNGNAYCVFFVIFVAPLSFQSQSLFATDILFVFTSCRTILQTPNRFTSPLTASPSTSNPHSFPVPKLSFPQHQLPLPPLVFTPQHFPPLHITMPTLRENRGK